MPSVLGLGLGTGKTDGQTDNGHRCIMPHAPYGDGGVIITHTDQLMCYFKL